MRALFLIFAFAICYQFVQAQCPTSIVVSETTPCGLEPVTFSVNPVTPGYSYTWDFGDPQAEENNDTGINDNTATGPFTAHAFTAGPSTTEYTVTLQAYDENGDTCTTLTQVINVQPAPSAILEGAFQNCPTQGPMSIYNLTVFDGGSTNGADSYVIDWGDGTPEWTGTSIPGSGISHDYPIGLFYLEFTVEDNEFSGCSTSTATYLVYNGTNPDLGLANSGNTTICLPDDIDFVITNTDLNTAGTIYYITINDGTDTITYTQSTLPDTINHVFNEISCGTDAGQFIDAFEFVIRAINPCDEKEAAIRPIRVGRRPTAEMSIVPEPPKCDTTVFTLLNETMNGVDFDDGMCSDEIITAWIITPLDGGTYDFVYGNPSRDSIEVQFTAGDYQIDLVVRNDCGPDTTTQFICIQPTPEASFTCSTLTGCTPLEVAINNLSNTFINMSDCSVVQYSWEVGHSDTTCDPPSDGSFIYINGTNASSPQPEIRFIDPGEYTLSMTVSNECGEETHQQTIIVADGPNGQIAPVDEVYCGSANVNFSMQNLSTCNDTPTFEWSFPGATPSTFSGENPTNIFFPEEGTYSVSVTITNACGASVATLPFSVLEGPEAIAALDYDADETCIPLEVNTTNNSTGDNLSYEWSVVPATGWNFIGGTDLNTPNPTFEFSEVGTYTISLIASSDCGSDTWTETITVRDRPPVELEEIPDAFCDIASIQPLAIYDQTGLVDEVTWSFPGGTPSSFEGLQLDGPVLYNEPGTYTFTITASNECGSLSDSHTFMILQGPDLEIVADTNFACIGDQITVINNSGGDNLTYEWTQISGPGMLNFIPPSGEEPTIDLSDATPGSYTYSVAIGNEICGTITQNFNLQISEPPVVELAELDIYCEVASLDLLPSYPNQSLVDSVFWQFPAGAMPVEESNDFDPGTITVEGPGDYTFSVSVFNACGESVAEQPFTILQGPMLDLAIPADTLCAGSSVMVENNSTGDQLAYTWTYEGNGNVTFSDATSPVPEATFPDTGVFVLNVLVGNPVCDPVSWSDTVWVLESPTVSFPAIPDDCGETTVELANNSVMIGNPGRLDSIRWTFPGGQPETSAGLYPGVINYDGAGSYTITAEVYNFCGTNTFSQSFQVLEPIEVDAQLSSDFSCELPFTINVENFSSGDQLNFEWSVTGPFADNVSFDPMVAEPSFVFQDTGLYVVTQTVFNDICGELTWSDTVTILAAPVPLLMPAEDFCESAVLLPEVDYQGYRIDSVLWEFPGGTPENSTDLFPAGVSYAGAGTYTYTLTAYNSCGSSVVSDEFVIDTIPIIDLGPTDTICITDGLYNLPSPSPAGGIWQDSLGQPGIVSQSPPHDGHGAGRRADADAGGAAYRRPHDSTGGGRQTGDSTLADQRGGTAPHGGAH